MSKGLIAALLLMGLTVVVLIFNRGDVKVDLIFTTVDFMKSIVFLVFMSIGIAIGVLLK